MRRLILALGWLAGALSAAAAPPPLVDLGQGADEFLPADEAFALRVEMPSADRILASWEIAEGYYLYRTKFGFRLAAGQAELEAPALPAGVMKEDEFFGRQEVYFRRVSVEIPVRWHGMPGGELTLEVRYQGCAEAGLCYAPQKRTVTLRPPRGGDSR